MSFAILLLFLSQSFAGPEVDMSLPVCPPIVTNKTPGKEPVEVSEMKATAYDDGNSCPGGCKPHVVFDPRHNGTRFAHKPLPGGSTQSQSPYQPCVKGQPCRVCFKPKENCVEVLYQGAGPPLGVFDFSVSYFKEKCSDKSIPMKLKDQCAYLDKQVARYKKERVNCFEEPKAPECGDVIAKAQELKNKDMPDYKLCEGKEDSFNASVVQSRKRTHDCHYRFDKEDFGFSTSNDASGKPCRKPKRWNRLLPAGCPEGRFVGEHGLDCCSADLYISAAAGLTECVAFFPKRAAPAAAVEVKPAAPTEGKK